MMTIEIEYSDDYDINPLWRVVNALAEFYIGGLGSDSEKGSDQPDILIGGFSILVYAGSLS